MDFDDGGLYKEADLFYKEGRKVLHKAIGMSFTSTEWCAAFLVSAVRIDVLIPAAPFSLLSAMCAHPYTYTPRPSAKVLQQKMMDNLQMVDEKLETLREKRTY